MNIALLKYVLLRMFRGCKPIFVIGLFVLVLSLIIYKVKLSPFIVYSALAQLAPFVILIALFIGFEMDSFCFDGLIVNKKEVLKEIMIIRYILFVLLSCLLMLFMLLSGLYKPISLVSISSGSVGIMAFLGIWMTPFFKKRRDYTKYKTNTNYDSFDKIYLYLSIVMYLVFFVCVIIGNIDNVYVYVSFFLFGVFLMFINFYWIKVVSKKCYKRRYILMQGFRGQ